MGEKRNAKGLGAFKINPDGTVTHRKSVGYKENGQRKVFTVTANTKAACLKEMKKKEDAWKRQNKSGSIYTSFTITDLCEGHLRYQIEQGELKPKSIDRRECTIENHIALYPLGRIQLQAVKVSDIDSHIGTLMKEGRLSVSSMEKVIDVLNAAYNWAITRGELNFNPVAPIKSTLDKRLQKIKQKSANEADVSVLSIEEERLFVQEAMSITENKGEYKYPAGLYGLLLLYTGMRCGEMLALRWGDVDLKHGILTIEKSRSIAKNRAGGEGNNKYVLVEGSTKNEKARKLALTVEALKVLKIIRNMQSNHDADSLIVRTRTGKGNTATNLEHRMATIFHNAGLSDLSGGLHIFRRTFASRLYEKGARAKEIAAYIGDLESTTEKYYIAVRKKRVVEGKVQQIVELPKAFQTDEKEKKSDEDF